MPKEGHDRDNDHQGHQGWRSQRAEIRHDSRLDPLRIILYQDAGYRPLCGLRTRTMSQVMPTAQNIPANRQCRFSTMASAGSAISSALPRKLRCR
jgi:hypothetical protein